MIETVLTSSVLIAVIALLRRLLRGRLDPRLQYALWLLAAARLLIPGPLFPVPVSLTEAAASLQTAIWKEASSSNGADLPDLEGITPVLTPLPPDTDSPLVPDAVHTENNAVLAAPESRSSWLGLVWRVGAAVTGGVLLLSNVSFFLLLRKKRRLLDPQPPAESWMLNVYVVDNLASPCLFGFLRPAIYLNRQAVETDRLEYVLVHERTHFRHKDHLWALLRSVCVVLHWYNPLVWWAAALSRRDCELACDDGAIRQLGDDRRLDYGATLLQMIVPERSPAALLCAATTMSAGKRTMKERIALIARRPQMLKATLAAVILIMCAVVAVTFGGAMGDSQPDNSGEPASDTGNPENNGPGEETAGLRSAGRLSSASYTHFSGMFSLTVPDSWLGEVVYVETEDGVSFHEASSYQAGEDAGWLMSVVPQPTDWAEVYDTNGIPLAEFDFNGSPYIYMVDLNAEPDFQENTQTLMSQSQLLADSFQLLADADMISRLVHDAYQGNMPLAVAYLPYLDWSSYSGLYGEDGMMDLMESLSAYIEDNDLDWGQYHDIMSNQSRSQPIDGAYATMIQEGILWRLYQKNPQRFASVIQSVFLTDAERASVLEWTRYPFSMDQGRTNFPEDALTDGEIYQILGISLTDGVTANYSDVTMQVGESPFQLKPVGMVGIYAAAYTTADPAVATVDENGLVTAVGPGTTDITLHVEGGGGQYDLVCTVRVPDSGMEPLPETSGTDSEQILSWQRQVFAEAFAVPAGPEGEMVYDSYEEDGLEQAVLSRLAEHAREYLGDAFSRIILEDLESGQPSPENPYHAVTVLYRVEAARTYDLNGEPYTVTGQGETLRTTYRAISISNMQGLIHSEMGEPDGG